MAKKKATRRRNNRESETVNEESPVVYDLLLFQGQNDRGKRDNLDRTLVSYIQELLRQIDSDRAQTEIDIWLDSPGGDAHAAYKLHLVLRDVASFIRVLVPDYAKSAATLLAIGADELYLAAAADLGPLDVQIDHPDREGRTISALAQANALEHIAKLGTDLTLSAGPKYIKMTKLPRADVLDGLLTFSARALEPILAKLDPQLIHESAEALKVTRRYAKRILQNRATNQLPEEAADLIASMLVNRYPTHGYVIDRQELESLFISTRKIDEHPHWPVVDKVFESFRESDRTLVTFSKRGDES